MSTVFSHCPEIINDIPTADNEARGIPSVLLKIKRIQKKTYKCLKRIEKFQNERRSTEEEHKAKSTENKSFFKILGDSIIKAIPFVLKAVAVSFSGLFFRHFIKAIA